MTDNQKDSVPDQNPREETTSGASSFLLLILAIIIGVSANNWHDANYQSSGGSGLGIAMGLIMFFLVIPLLIISFFKSLAAISRDSGKKLGVVTLSSILLIAGLTIGIMIYG